MSNTQIGIKITADPSGVEQGVGRAKRSLADFKSSGEQSLGGIGQAAGMLQGKLAAIGGGLSIGLAVGQLVQVQREFDKLNSSLVTVAGGSAAAGREMEWLKQFAKETPFGLAQATAGFVKMKALGLDPTRAALTSFGNTAAAMGKDLNQMIEAVADASTGEFERLKEFGIKAKKEGDQVKLTFQGVTTSIGNNAGEITKYLEGLGNVQFAGAMAQRANTLDGAIASLGDTWDEMFRTISAGDVGSTITDSVRMAEAAVGDLTTIIKALDGATAGSAAQTSVLAGAQDALATAFEAIAVLGVNVKYTLVQIGNELGGLAAQAVAVATGQFAQAAAISGMMRADAKKAREEVDATSARILSARSVAALGQPNNYDEPAVLRARAAAEKAAADARAAAAKADRDAAAAEAARAAAAKESAKDAKKAAEAELEWRRKTTLDMVKLWDDQAEAAQKSYDAARAGALKLAEATEAAQAATTTGLIDKLAAMRDEIDAIGLTTAQQSELNAVKAEQVIADKELQLIMLQNADASVVQIQLLEQEINLRKQLVVAMRTKAGKEAVVEAGKEATKAADEAAKAGQKAGEQIEKDITDALMRGFESGKGFAQNMADATANIFKSMVLRPTIQATVQGGMNAMGFGPGGAQGGSSNAFSQMGTGNYLPMYNQFATSNAGQYLGLSTPGTVDVMGDGVYGSSATLTGFGESVGKFTQAAGQFLGYANALNTAFSRNAQGGKDYGSAAGMAVGTFFGGPIGSMIGGEIGKMLGLVDYGGTYHSGGMASYSAAGGAAKGDAVKGTLGFDLAAKDYTAGAEKAASQIAAAVAGMLDSTAVSFGKTAGAYVATGFADDISPDGAWGALMVKMGDSLAIDWKSGADQWPGREFADGEAGAKAYAAAVATDVRDYLLTQTPDWADAMLSALGDTPTLENLSTVVAQINAAAAAMEGMGKASTAFAGMSEAAASALIAAMGGAEAAVTNLSGYYTNFYSESERAGIATADLTKQLADMGQALPASREAFRGVVDAAVAAGDTTLAAGLIKLQDEFAALVPAADSAAKAVSGVMSSLEADTKRLQRQLIEAQGGDLAAFDTQGMTLAERAVYAYNASLQEQIDATKAASTAAKEAAAAQEQAARDATEAAQEYARAQEQAAQAARAAVETAMSAVSSAQSTIDGIRGEATNRYLSAQQAVANAQDNIANLQVQAMQKVQQAAYDAAKKLQDLGKTLTEFVTGKLSSPEQTFANTLRKALAGDTEAMAALPNAATGASDAAALAASTSTEARIAQARIMADVLRVANLASGTALPGVTPDADPMVAATNALTQAQADMAAALTVVTTIGASTTARADTLLERYATAVNELATAQDEYAIALAAIAGSTASTATNTAAQIIATATLQSALMASLASGFASMDADNNGLLTIAEFKSGLVGKASDAELTRIFTELDTNGNGVLTKLEAIRVSTTNTATNTASTSTGAAMVVQFSASDPLRAVFDNITRSNALLADAQQLALQMILGVSIGEDMRAAGSRNSEFTGTYQLQYDIRTYLSNIASSAASLVNMAAGPGMTVRDIGGGGATTSAPVDMTYTNALLTDANSRLATSNTRLQQVFDVNLLTGAYIRGASEGWGSFKIRGATSAFAKGGAFTNQIVNSPTMFDMGLMGEAGPEAIMPLQRSADGRLGVVAQMPDWSQYVRGDNGSAAVVAELQALRASNEALREENQSQARAIVQINQRMTKVLERWDGTGIPEQRVIA